MAGLVERLTWDSKFFGFPIGRVDLDGATPDLRMGRRRPHRSRLGGGAQHRHAALAGALGLPGLSHPLRVPPLARRQHG
jgi:hypothetical protein